jgi:bla regulator protein BlaR1
MPALFIFLFKVNIALVLFCLGYYLVLRHLTFYTLNRVYLVTAILFSTLYPVINLSNFTESHKQFTQPVQNIITTWKAPAEDFVKPLYRPDYLHWVELIFWAGVVLFAARLIMQLFSLYKLYRRSEPGKVNNYPVRLINKDISPFSFWRNIYINPANLSSTELKNVLAHEQVHVSEWHTLDILLAELSTIFYWFNPGVWLMKKAVRENIEFVTDQKILQKGIDSKQYQYSLLSISLATTSNTIVNHFNISTIKKRIIMMNAKRSSKLNLTRYAFVVPAVLALLLIFSISKAAISKSGVHRLKSIVAKISTINIVNSSKLAVAKVIANTLKPAANKVTVKNIDTIYAGDGKSKDGGRKHFLLRGKANPDSINYVINGVIATKGDLNAINPGQIESMELLSANGAKGFFQGINNNQKVLFIATDDSETGKKLAEKINASMRKGVLARVKNLNVTTNESADIAPKAGSSVSANVSTSESLSNSQAVIVDDNLNADVVVVNGFKSGLKKGMALKKKVYFKSLTKDEDVDIDDDAPGQANVEVYRVSPSSKMNAHLYDLKKEASIDNIADKLILIDGKVATEKEMKNLKMTDIKSLTEKSDLSTKMQYGDKAKNGVLFITTVK